MGDAREYLRAYDEQLRTDAETPGAVSVERLGPLRLVTFAGGRGFITYQDLGGADAEAIATYVEQALGHFRERDEISRVEWKTRGHDQAPGLHDALVSNGFEPEEPESIMIGEARLLAGQRPVPDGVTVRRISSEADVRAMCELQAEVFEEPIADELTTGLLRRQSRDPSMQLWVAEADGTMVSSGRLEPVAGTEFAGIWGGGTLVPWRGRGIYRALTAIRAQEALSLGKRLINSDSTAYSRPILERSGLIKVSTTTPYTWWR